MKEERRRLPKVATVCKNYEQRAQLSVFACQVNQAQYEALRAQLVSVINKKLDNLRFDRLSTPRQKAVEAYGMDHNIDFDQPLIL